MNPGLLTGYERLESTLAQCVDDVCDRFERAWRAGQRPAIEAHLDGVPASERLVLLRELVLLDIPYRRQAGEAPRPDDYQRRFPALDAAWLAQALAARMGWEHSPLTPPVPEPEPPPAQVPGYELLGELGQGGMGVVYKARDVRLGRFVALKFLPTEAARDPRRLERFRREARAASALNHPAICTLYSLREHQGRPFLVLEWVEGQTLRALVGPRPDLGRLLPLVRQVAQALRVTHAAGIVHRDIKPENLMVRPDGYVKVLDFGLARLLPAPALAGPKPSDSDTEPGALIGTVRYMSPEQARGEPAGDASDLFSLGIVLYELATGRYPFEADSPAGLLHAIDAEEPLPPARLNPEVPALLEALILQMLAKDLRRRPTAAEVEALLGVLAGDGTGSRTPAAAPAGRRSTVGRGPQRDELWAGFEAAAGGGLVLCVTGEPGIGKTTLVEEFLAELAASGRICARARGRCSQRLAGAEAYLPVLEALDGLLRGEAGEVAARALRLLAPTWYAQLAPPAAADRMPPPSSSPERMKHELFAFLQELALPGPVVLFLDDVHWADASTTDLLAYLGGRCTELRLLVVLTYRRAELLLGRHPFTAVQRELQRQGACREVALGFLDRDEVASYLALEFPGHAFPAEFAGLIHGKTEGNPLFMVDLLRYLRDRGVIAQRDGRWALAQAVPDFQRELPESVRSMIRRMIAELSEEDRRLLSAASVQGHEFDSAVAARLLGREAAEVEERLEVLDRVYGFVRLRRGQELPDGTLTLRYQFVHTLYQNALYQALQPTRRAEWSAAVAQALLGRHGEQSAAAAGELALLFEAARDYNRATDYFLLAAGNAAGMAAPQEAAALARRGLSLLRKLPDTPERGRSELRLLVMLGRQLEYTQGFAAPQVGRTYRRASELCRGEGEAAQLAPVMWGLWAFAAVRAEHPAAHAAAEELLRLAEHRREPALSLPAHNAMGGSSLHTGDPAAALAHFERGAVVPEDGPRPSSPPPGEFHRVSCLAFGALALWLLGFPDQARARSREAVARAREQADLPSLAAALYLAAVVHQCRRELRAAREHAEAVMALTREHGFPFWLAGGTVLRGWGLTGPEGVAQLRQGLTDWEATKALTHRPYHLGLLAEALGREAQFKEALGAVAEALAVTERTGERFYEAELHRLRGELLLRRGAAGGEAEVCFRQALAVAARQGARSLELRAALSLARLLGRPGRPTLAEAYGCFTEGWDTPDLQEAKALLDELA